MKPLIIPLLLFVIALPAAAQGETESAPQAGTAKWDVEIPEPIIETRPLMPAVKPAPIRFEVIHSRTKKVDVVQAPEMHDLPPITGRINFTIQRVEDPGLPDPPKPASRLDANDPKVAEKIAELRENYRGTNLIFISASVYDHKRTLLRIHNGGEDRSEVTAWSNLDLNHFCGHSIYRVKDAVDGTPYDYGFIMGIGNENPEMLARLSSQKGWIYEAPEIPQLPDVENGGPAFVLMEGDEASPAMATLEQLHDLYRKEGKRMEADFLAREKAHGERKAYLLANPTKPKDVTIRVWNRKRSHN